MTKVRVAGFSISLDGFGAGPDQSLETPLGRRGLELHQWFFGTRTFRAMTGEGGGSEGVDEAYAHRSMDGFGAFILGRNMFGPIRGPWPDESWKGWWGANPPYHAPTFVLTHHQRDPIEMEGGTTFIFVTEGIEAALDQAKRAAEGGDVKIGGGVETRRALQEFRAASGIGEGDAEDEATERLVRAQDAKAANKSDINFVGGWGIDLAECRESPIKITARRAEAFGTACEFHSTQRKSSNVWRLRAECASKAERWNANIRFTVSTSKLTWASERGTTTYMRCPIVSASR